MRYAKRNLRIVAIGTAVILTAAVISLSSHTKSLRPVIQAEEQNGSALEAVLGNDILPNTAYDWGSVYTLNDGTDIAQKYVNEESGYTVYGGAEGYQVLGSDTGGGLVQGMGNILLSSVAKANRLARTGDSIVTTLHSSAMAAANEALAEYGGDVQAGICVVLRDGAVLVDAGNNVLSSPADVYLGITEQTDSFVNYNASAMAKGSVFKAITARTLLEYDGDLPEDYSLYNDSFEDLSAITLNSGKTIQNWDYNIAGDYGSDLGNGQYSRLVSLSDALQFSSNTYFVRHALQLPDCYDKLRDHGDQFIGRHRNRRRAPALSVLRTGCVFVQHPALPALQLRILRRVLRSVLYCQRHSTGRREDLHSRPSAERSVPHGHHAGG